MKSYTDLEQSKVLVGILPIESADMFYNPRPSNEIPYVGNTNTALLQVPCWSLSALLNLLPADKIITIGITIEDNKKIFSVGYMDKQRMYQAEKENMVDACYEMILKLHELKML